MNTSINPLVIGVLEAYRNQLEIHTHNNEVDIVAINLGENKIMVNRENTYLLNQTTITLPNLLNEIFVIESSDGSLSVKLKDVQLDELMDAFQLIHDKKTS